MVFICPILCLGAVVLVLGHEWLIAWMEIDKPATIAALATTGE
jgi:hypothetical protein